MNSAAKLTLFFELCKEKVFFFTFYLVVSIKSCNFAPDLITEQAYETTTDHTDGVLFGAGRGSCIARRATEGFERKARKYGQVDQQRQADDYLVLGDMVQALHPRVEGH